MTTGRKAYNPPCEPTQICETYKFIAYPAPNNTAFHLPDIEGPGTRNMIWAWLYANRARFGPLIERVLCCIVPALELIDGIKQGKLGSPASALTTYTNYASALADLAAEFAVHRCPFVRKASELREEAGNFHMTSALLPTDTARLEEIGNRLGILNSLWIEIVSECFCSALLPACPKLPATNCVPLAVVTLADGDCRIVEICNWSERKLLISWPTVGYWLSWLPWHKLMDSIAAMCCGPRRGRETLALLEVLLGVVFGTAAESKPSTAAPPASTVFPGALGIRAARSARAAGPPPIEPLERAFLSDDFLAHMLGSFARLRADGPDASSQPAWAGLVARLSDPSSLAPTITADSDISALTRRLDVAEATILEQAKEIKTLKTKVRR